MTNDVLKQLHTGLTIARADYNTAADCAARLTKASLVIRTRPYRKDYTTDRPLLQVWAAIRHQQEMRAGAAVRIKEQLLKIAAYHRENRK